MLEDVQNNAIGAITDSMNVLYIVFSTKIRISRTMAPYNLPSVL